jgi:DNA polymerase III delta prime subunit
MITWLAITQAWKSFCTWCKERWELLVGILVGVLGVFALRGGNTREARQILEKKNELKGLEDEALKVAREKEDAALRENIESFFERDEEAKEEYLSKLVDLDEEKKKRIRELLASDNPEDQIAKVLKDYLE